MIYSKTVLSLDKLPAFPLGKMGTGESFLEQARDVKELLDGVRRVFDPQKIACISTLILQHHGLLTDLIMYDELLRAQILVNPSLSWEARQDALQVFGFPVREAFNSITRLVVITKRTNSWSLHNALKAGISWLSLYLEPNAEVDLLQTSPKLEEIAVHKGTDEQVNKIVDGHAVVADSGMRLGGFADWF